MSCIKLSVLLSTVLVIFATINAFTCVFTDKIIYETPVRSQFNLTSVSFITSKITNIDQSLVAFVYFLIYMVGEVFKSFYLITCKRPVKSRVYLNPDSEPMLEGPPGLERRVSTNYMLDPNAPPGIPARLVRSNPKKYDLLDRNNARVKQLAAMKKIQQEDEKKPDNRGFSAIFVYPVLFILLHVLCGITNVFMLVRVAALSCALEVIRFVFRDTLWIIWIEIISLTLIWISLIIASARLKNKIVLGLFVVGALNMAMEIFVRHFPKYIMSVIPALFQMGFHIYLLVTCCVGYFY